MQKTTATTWKSTIDLLYYHILSLSIGIPLCQQQPATNNDEPKKNTTHQIGPFFLSAGISAILIAICHMAVIIKAKKQAYKMVYSPWGGLVGRWAAYAYDNHLNRTFWCTYQLLIRRRPFVISCPNICNYCSHNTNKATGVGCGCRDDCTASDDDVVTGGWCTTSS